MGTGNFPHRLDWRIRPVPPALPEHSHCAAILNRSDESTGWVSGPGGGLEFHSPGGELLEQG